VATHLLIKSRANEKHTDGRMMAVNKASSWMFTKKMTNHDPDFTFLERREEKDWVIYEHTIRE